MYTAYHSNTFIALYNLCRLLQQQYTYQLEILAHWLKGSVLLPGFSSAWLSLPSSSWGSLTDMTGDHSKLACTNLSLEISFIFMRYAQVWWIVPVKMIGISIFLIILPLTIEPGPSLGAFAIILTGAPVYFFFVMETPWKLRPAFLDRFSCQWRNIWVYSF